MNNIVNAILLLVQAIKSVRISPVIGGGFFYISSPAGTTVTVANTYYKIAGTYGTISSELFTVSAGGTVTYNGTIPISIHLTVSVSLKSNTNNVVVKFSPALNGSTDSRLVLSRKIATVGDVGALTGSGPFTIQPGDELEIHVTCDNAGTILTADQMLVSIHSIN